ncbi:MAG: penicillin-binding transpeptidase domain-containing protein [Cyclobacteriaceae bacterium]
MKALLIIIASVMTVIVVGCDGSDNTSRRVNSEEFRVIIDSSKLVGALLVCDEAKNVFYSNDFQWSEKKHLPASTFKIPNSMIALETGVIENASDTIFYTGEQRMFDSWEEDMTLKSAFHRSCLPCYQQLSRKVGFERMRSQVSKLGYGEMNFDSTSFDSFWVKGTSGISQFQQIDFLKRFYHSELPISKKTEEMIKITENGYELSAKTGWSITDDKDNGWYVGFLEVNGRVYYFATNVSPGEGFNRARFSAIRKEITFQGLKVLGVIN